MEEEEKQRSIKEKQSGFLKPLKYSLLLVVMPLGYRIMQSLDPRLETLIFPNSFLGSVMKWLILGLWTVITVGMFLTFVESLTPGKEKRRGFPELLKSFILLVVVSLGYWMMKNLEIFPNSFLGSVIKWTIIVHWLLFAVALFFTLLLGKERLAKITRNPKLDEHNLLDSLARSPLDVKDKSVDWEGLLIVEVWTEESNTRKVLVEKVVGKSRGKGQERGEDT